MARRLLTVSELTFNRKRKPDETFAPADLGGEDLLDVFHDWVTGLSHDDTHNKGKQTWINVTSAKRWAPRVEVIELRVGSYGEQGEVVDVETGADAWHRQVAR